MSSHATGDALYLWTDLFMRAITFNNLLRTHLGSMRSSSASVVRFSCASWAVRSSTSDSSVLAYFCIIARTLSKMLELLRTHTSKFTTKTRNTLDCEQSDVYSSHVIFSSFSPNLTFYSFCLITARPRSATLPCKISTQSPVICVSSLYSVRQQSMVCVGLHAWSGADNALQSK